MELRQHDDARAQPHPPRQRGHVAQCQHGFQDVTEDVGVLLGDEHVVGRPHRIKSEFFGRVGDFVPASVRAYAERKFSLEEMVRKYESLYREIVHGRASGGERNRPSFGD